MLDIHGVPPIIVELGDLKDANDLATESAFPNTRSGIKPKYVMIELLSNFVSFLFVNTGDAVKATPTNGIKGRTGALNPMIFNVVGKDEISIVNSNQAGDIADALKIHALENF